MKNTIKKSPLLGKYAQPTETKSVTCRISKSDLLNLANSTQLQGKKNSLTETNLFTHSPIHLFTLKRGAFTLAEGATHVAHCNKSHRGAFTLAEVLITLGIIGVVAALTIPSLVAKYQKHVLKNQFLKAYSNLQNAINMTISANGTGYDCYTYVAQYHDTECVAFWNDFMKNLKILKTCDYKAGKCNVRYKTQEEAVAAGGTTHNPTCSFLRSAQNDIYILADGSYFIESKAGVGSHNTLYFTLDVNGGKGPNKWGYDVFYFMLDKDVASSTIKITDRICALKEKGGYYASEMITKNKL